MLWVRMTKPLKFDYFFFLACPLRHRNTGSATMPHAEFWREFPGLVSTGCTFSICQCCGIRGDSGARYNKASARRGREALALV